MKFKTLVGLLIMLAVMSAGVWGMITQVTNNNMAAQVAPPTNLVDSYLPLKPLYDKLKLRAVHLITDRGFGCGTIVNQKQEGGKVWTYWVWTVNHLVGEHFKEGATSEMTVLSHDRTYLNTADEVILLQRSPEFDFMVLKFQSPIDLKLDKIVLASPKQLETIMMVGAPFHTDIKPHVGYVMLEECDLELAYERKEYKQHYFIANIANGPGNSGSGVFDLNGNLIGLHSARILETPWYGIVVKVSSLTEANKIKYHHGLWTLFKGLYFKQIIQLSEKLNLKDR